MNGPELRIISNNRKKTKEKLLSLFILHPQAFQTGIGAEGFIDQFIKAFEKYAEYSDEEMFAINNLSQLIRGFPQIIRPETKAVEFIEDLHRAAGKYEEYFGKAEVQ